MIEPTISLLVPVFGDQVHISEFLLSVLPNLASLNQVILVDDDNTPDVSQLLRSFALSHRDKVELVISSAPLGISKATELGLRLSKSTFTMFADCDDILSPQLVSTVRQSLSDSVDVVSTDFSYLKGKLAVPRDRERYIKLGGVSEPWHYASVHNLITHSKTVRTSLATTFTWASELDGVQDAMLNFHLISQRARVKLVAASLYTHRLHHSQTTNHLSASISSKLNDSRRKMIELFRSRSTQSVIRKAPSGKAVAFAAHGDSDQWIPIHLVKFPPTKLQVLSAVCIRFRGSDVEDMLLDLMHVLHNSNAAVGLCEVDMSKQALDAVTSFEGALDFVFCKDDLTRAILSARLGPNRKMALL